MITRRSRRKAALVAALSLIGLAGCSARIHTPLQHDVLPARLAHAALGTDAFDYRRRAIEPDIAPAADTENYWVRSLSLPSFGENGQEGNLVTARYYRGKGPGAKPLIIVLPIWGVSRYPSDTISKDLRDRAGGTINLLQILGEDALSDWDAMADAKSEAEFLGLVEQMADRLVNTVIDVRRLVDWAERQPGVDPERIALIGFSMGALVASIAIAKEPRLGAGILVMGGADLHEAFAACDGGMGQVRETVTRRFGWTVDQFRKKVEPPLARINPTSVASLISPDKILIIEAANDTCLLRAGRDRLWQVMGRPERIAYLYDHKMAFLAMTILGGNNIQQQVHRFLEQTILPDLSDSRYEAEHISEERQEQLDN